jgi:hypothetical protein
LGGEELRESEKRGEEKKNLGRIAIIVLSSKFDLFGLYINKNKK